jgi:YQGE family putative transporter
LGGNLSYQILSVLLLFIYLASGITVLPLSMHPSEHAHGFLTLVKGKWNLMRLACYVFGFQSGINFILPSVLVLLLLGNEGILGSVNSLGALLSAIFIYQIGKRSLSHHRLYIFAFGVIILILGALAFALYPFSFGIVSYVVAVTIAVNFTWSSYSPMLMDVIDQYTSTKKQNRFKYIVDHELFLNLGRLTGVGMLSLLLFVFSRSFALRFIPIIIALFQILVVFLLNKIVKKDR